MRQIKRIGFIFVILVIIFLGFYSYLVANYFPPILMYHQIDQVLAEKNTIAVSSDIFARQMDFIKRHNYNVISLEGLCEMLKKKNKLPHNLVVITFDDGYKNNLTAIKVLKEYSFPATIFLVVNWIDKENYLSREDLDWIVKNSKVCFGSHTLNHPYLPEISIEELRQEISGSKQKAKEEYSVDLLTLAYPVGGFIQDALQEAKEAGYLCACSTNRGFSRKLDIYALRRIKITNRDLGIRLWGKLSGFYNLFRRPKPPY